ncbi:MAG: dihydrodipicolinate synthase family protein [Ruminococcaceae bacterium]|nr:dihydrodipicolinate synthase family protein [Oscillospiraceae bacterium]
MKFTGIMPALVTPLNEDETINTKVLAQLIEDMIQNGADGFYVAGATGEGLALRPSERRVLAEAAVRAANHRKPCIIQVASTDFNEAVALAKHAESVGADAISATPPLFFGYDADEVYNYYKALAGAVHIPVMIYYNPNAGFPMDAKFAARAFEVDNITAIKWTSPNYYQMMELKRLTQGDMNIINGPDEMLLMGLSAGADGGIGTTYNFMFDIYRGIYDKYHAGDLAGAQALQRKSAEIVSAAFAKYSCIPATKALVEALGYDVGNATFPLARLTKAEKAELIADVKAAGLKI